MTKVKSLARLFERKNSFLVSAAMTAAALTTAHAEPVAPVADRPVENTHTDMMAEGAAVATGAHKVHEFHIPAGSLGDAITAYEQATGVKVGLPSQDVSGIQTKGAEGVLSYEEALTHILSGTGLAGAFLSEDRVQLKLRAADQNVTVTADTLNSVKYTAPLRDLPQTLTVIPETILQNTASTSLMDALRTVSGITFGAGEGGNPTGDRPFLRGVDSQASTFVDNMRDIGAQSREVFDVESIEIAKGPSGGFVGRGAGGGSINLNSKLARRDKFVSATFAPGSASFYRGTVDADAKFTRWFAGRINGMAQDADMAGRDAIHNNRYGIAPALLFNFGERVRLFANYYHLNQNGLMDPGIPYNNPTYFPRTDGIQRIYQAGDGQPLLLNRNDYYGLTSRDFRYEKAKTAFGRLEVNVWKNAILRNSYRYGKSNQDYLYSQADDSQGNIYYGMIYRRALTRNTVVDTSIDQTDLAGSGHTGAIKHTYATGFEFSRERTWNATYTPTVPVYVEQNTSDPSSPQYISASRCPLGVGAVGGYYCTDLFHPTYRDPWAGISSVGVVSTTDHTAKTWTNSIVKTTTPTKQRTITGSLYGFDTIQFLPQLLATVGLRYDHYDSAYRAAVTCVPTPTVPCNYATVNNLVNYQGALTYKPKQAISIYASVASSATPPGNALSQGQDSSAITSIQNQALAPEKNRTEEFGVKWELLGGKAMASGAWFQADTQNVRITQSDGNIYSAGSRRNRGLDFGLTGYLTRKWQIFTGYTYMNAILQHTGVTNGTDGLLDGRRFPNTPQHSFAFTSYYQVTKKLNVGGGVYATGKVFGNDNPSTQYTMKWVPAYARVDIFGAYSINKHWQVQGNLQNVGDKAYFLQAYTTHFAQLAPGRQGMVTLKVLF